MQITKKLSPGVMVIQLKTWVMNPTIFAHFDGDLNGQSLIPSKQSIEYLQESRYKSGKNGVATLHAF